MPDSWALVHIVPAPPKQQPTQQQHQPGVAAPPQHHCENPTLSSRAKATHQASSSSRPQAQGATQRGSWRPAGASPCRAAPTSPRQHGSPGPLLAQASTTSMDRHQRQTGAGAGLGEYHPAQPGRATPPRRAAAAAHHTPPRRRGTTTAIPNVLSPPRDYPKPWAVGLQRSPGRNSSPGPSTGAAEGSVPPLLDAVMDPLLAPQPQPALVERTHAPVPASALHAAAPPRSLGGAPSGVAGRPAPPAVGARSQAEVAACSASASMDDWLLGAVLRPSAGTGAPSDGIAVVHATARVPASAPGPDGHAAAAAATGAAGAEGHLEAPQAPKGASSGHDAVGMGQEEEGQAARPPLLLPLSAVPSFGSKMPSSGAATPTLLATAPGQSVLPEDAPPSPAAAVGCCGLSRPLRQRR